MTRRSITLVGASLAVPILTDAAEFPSFRCHEIDRYPAGYQVAVADLNRDGWRDVIALSTEANRVDWYAGPNWTPHPVARTVRNIDLAPRDLDGDGTPEIALASGFYFSESNRGGDLQWLAQPKQPTNLWAAHPIAVDPVTHRLRWGDLDGDGRAELVHAPIFGPGSRTAVAPTPSHLWAFRPPEELGSGRWDVWKIDEALTVLHGLHVADLDGDGRDEILAASFEGITRFDFEGSRRTGRWTKALIASGTKPKTTAPGAPRGASEVAPGRLKNGNRFLATIEPWHGELVIVYTPPADLGPWRRHLFDDTLNEGHALLVADLDGDEQDEIIAGWRGGKGGIALYRAEDSNGERWIRRLVDEGIPVEGMAAADLNRDGLVDLVAMAGRANRLVWYEQRRR